MQVRFPTFIGLFIVLLIAAFSFAPSRAIGASVTPITSGSPMEKITIETPKGSFAWTIELASDGPSRAIGLMNRSSMAAASGMLFRFDETQPVAMWMKNTLIPLDMVFLDTRGRIRSIHRSAVPHSLDIINSNGPVRYVLEINAGEADNSGLQIGGKFLHPWFAAGE